MLTERSVCVWLVGEDFTTRRSGWATSWKIPDVIILGDFL